MLTDLFRGLQATWLNEPIYIENFLKWLVKGIFCKELEGAKCYFVY